MPQTSHLTESDVAAALDSANSPAGTRARAHARACGTCHALVQAARADERQVARWLETLDHPVPAVDPRTVLGRATRERALHPRRPRRTPGIARLPVWAAGAMLVGVAAAAAAVVTTSSTRHLIERMTHAVKRSSPAAPTSVADTLRVATSAQALRGVAVVPVGSATITFESSQRRGSVRIASGTSAALSVEADADGPTYTVGTDVVIVHNHSADTGGYRVLVPTHAGVRVIIAGLPAFQQRASEAGSTIGTDSTGVVVPLQRREPRAH